MRRVVVVFIVVASAAVDDCVTSLARGWRVCVARGDDACGDAAWAAPELPTTALAALLAGKKPGVWAEAPAGDDPFYSTNLRKIRDVNETGRAFYTLRYERALPTPNVACGARRRLELPAVNYRVRAFADGAPVEATTAFGGAFSRVVFDDLDDVRSVALVVEPPDHPGSADCQRSTVRPCGQGGDHALANDVTPQFMLGWDWMHAIPDRSTGFWVGAPFLVDHQGVTVRDFAVRTVGLVRSGQEGDAPRLFAPARLEVRATLSSRDAAVQRWRATLRLRGESSNVTTVEVEGSVALGGSGESVDVVEHVDVSSVELWWPHGVLERPSCWRPRLHDACFQTGTTTTTRIRFGVRTTAVDDSSRLFRVNGIPFFVRGGNWIATSAMPSARTVSKQRYAAEVGRHRAAGLNLIRVWGGGGAEADFFFEAADSLGVMVYQEFFMTGDNNGRWAGSYASPLDHTAFAAAVEDVVRRQRRFASLLLYGGGNELYPRAWSPPSDIWAATEALVAAHAPGTLLVASSMDGGVLGGDEKSHDASYALAVKDGPYTMLLPTAWSEKNPGLPANLTIPFQPEIGSTAAPPTTRALRRFLAPEEADAFPCMVNNSMAIHEAWALHKYEDFSSSTTTTTAATMMTESYDHVGAYGAPRSVEDWVAFAKVAQHQQYQYLFESYAAKLGDNVVTGVVVWKTQSPWPALRGFFYDWYDLEPTGGLRGAAVANGAPRGLVLDHASRCLVAHNAGPTPWSLPPVGLDWFDRAGNRRGGRDLIDLTNEEEGQNDGQHAPRIVDPFSARRLPSSDVAFPCADGDVCWLRLTLRADATFDPNPAHDRIIIADTPPPPPPPKWYWLTSDRSTPDYAVVGEMFRSKLARLRVEDPRCSYAGGDAGEGTIVVSMALAVAAGSPELVFYPEVYVDDVLQVVDDGATTVLLPGDAPRRITLRVASSTGEEQPLSTLRLRVDAFNAPPVDVALDECALLGAPTHQEGMPATTGPRREGGP